MSLAGVLTFSVSFELMHIRQLIWIKHPDEVSKYKKVISVIGIVNLNNLSPGR